MARKYNRPIYFSNRIVRRYKALKIKTPFKDKIKALTQEFIEKKEQDAKNAHS